MSHYHLSKILQQDNQLKEDAPDYQLEPSTDIGTAKAKDKKEESLSHILDKLTENEAVMSQIANNTREQAMLGDFPQAIDDAILGSNEAHQEQMMQLLSDPTKTQQFARVIFDMLSGYKG
ncbi:hypothetical protein AB4376_18125 [Vibrio breoganii]